MRHFEDDYEIEAIDKCTRALARIDDRTKIRVIRFLLDKFGLIAEQNSDSNKQPEVVNNIIHNQQNNLVLAEPKNIEKIGASNITHPGNIIALKDILIKNLAKTEPELMVVIGYYNSNFGKSTFTKQSILDSYKDNNIVNENRKKNLVQNLNSLIRRSYINTITDEEFSITEEGCVLAQNILSGNSTSKKRKPKLSKKSKSVKSATESVEESTLQDELVENELIEDESKNDE